ncbi:Uncharacterized protein PPKH_2054 [Pseudomonas putida]|nr:Uncharacterized protein PPKH_2054 [Pseudomonas putida]
MPPEPAFAPLRGRRLPLASSAISPPAISYKHQYKNRA